MHVSRHLMPALSAPSPWPFATSYFSREAPPMNLHKASQSHARSRVRCGSIAWADVAEPSPLTSNRILSPPVPASLSAGVAQRSNSPFVSKRTPILGVPLLLVPSPLHYINGPNSVAKLPLRWPTSSRSRDSLWRLHWMTSASILNTAVRYTTHLLSNFFPNVQI